MNFSRKFAVTALYDDGSYNFYKVYLVLVIRRSISIIFHLQIEMNFYSRLMDFYTSRSSGSSKSRYIEWYASIEEMKIITKQKRTTFVLGHFSKKKTQNTFWYYAKQWFALHSKHKRWENLPLSSAQPTSCLQKTIDLRSHELPNTSNAVEKCFSKFEWIYRQVMSYQNSFCALELRPPNILSFCFLSSAWKTKEYFVSSSSSSWRHFTFSSLLAFYLGNKT